MAVSIAMANNNTATNSSKAIKYNKNVFLNIKQRIATDIIATISIGSVST